jgi:hypothetical protein
VRQVDPVEVIRQGHADRSLGTAGEGKLRLRVGLAMKYTVTKLR